MKKLLITHLCIFVLAGFGCKTKESAQSVNHFGFANEQLSQSVLFIGSGLAYSRPKLITLPEDRDLYLLEGISKAGSLSQELGNLVCEIHSKWPGTNDIKITKVSLRKVGPRDHKLMPGDIVICARSLFE